MKRVGGTRFDSAPQVEVVFEVDANGIVVNPTYAVDLSFIGTTLAPKLNLNVGSCTLPFSLAKHQASPNDPTNFGLLIGRDVMRWWHIAWDGPMSIVIISD